MPSPIRPPSEAIHRDWIASQFSKGVHAEMQMASEARERAASPPQPDLGVLYTQIADADVRHRDIVETVAVRYGHTPDRKSGGGIGGTLNRLKDKVASIGSSPLDTVAHDLEAKSNAIHWYAAWVHAFEAIGERPLEVAATLRASPWDTFVSVVLPLAKPGYLTATVMGFAHTVGEFGVVLMLGGNIPDKTRVVSVQIYDHVEALEYAQAHWLSAGMVTFSFVVLLTLYIVNSRSRQPAAQAI